MLPPRQHTTHLPALGLALVVTLGSACAPRPMPRTPSTAVVNDGPAEAPPDRDELVWDLRATVLETYRALHDGYPEAFLDYLSTRRRVLFVDVGPTPAYVRGPPARQIVEVFSEEPPEFVSKSLEVHLSADAETAWTFDEVSLRLAKEGHRIAIPLRITGVWERTHGRWLIAHGHVSYGIPDERAFAEATAGRIPAPGALGPDSRPDARTAAVRATLHALLAAPDDETTHRVDTSPQALLVASDPDREARGAAVAGVATPRMLYGQDLHATPKELRVELSRSGTLAWGAANLVLSGPGEDGKPALPLRATWVLEWREGRWVVVQTHVSAPISGADLEMVLLGDPLDEARAPG